MLRVLQRLANSYPLSLYQFEQNDGTSIGLYAGSCGESNRLKVKRSRPSRRRGRFLLSNFVIYASLSMTTSRFQGGIFIINCDEY